MALKELVLESLKNEKQEIEVFSGEPNRKTMLEAYAEALVVFSVGGMKAYADIGRVLIEHAYYIGYQRGKLESPDAKRLEDLLGDVDLSKLDRS